MDINEDIAEKLYKKLLELEKQVLVSNNPPDKK